MRCSRNHEMVQLLRNWVCDQCDAEKARSRIMPSEPFEDPDYELVVKIGEDETGNAQWANEQLQKGRTVEVARCAHQGLCKGLQWRYRKGNVERRDAKGFWREYERMSGPGHQLFVSTASDTFRLVKNT